MQTPRIVLILT